MNLKLTSREDKLFAKVGDLFGWDKNPKLVLRKDFDRLKNQISDLGQFKPIIITPEGEVIGGNSRLAALQALGIEEAWVSVVEPKDASQKIKYALADNDQVGDYVEEQLAELLADVEIDFPLEDYKISVGKDIDLNKVLESIGLDDSTDQSEAPGEKEKTKRTMICPHCKEEIEL